MKVIRTGTNPLTPWWLDRQQTCARCGCQFQIEAGDNVREVADPRDGDYAVVACPTCGRVVTFMQVRR